MQLELKDGAPFQVAVPVFVPLTEDGTELDKEPELPWSHHPGPESSPGLRMEWNKKKRWFFFADSYAIQVLLCNLSVVAVSIPVYSPAMQAIQTPTRTRTYRAPASKQK